ncbi:MAG: flagellar biosynthetic protein FliR [Bdellovibrionota bacterium]
MDVLSLFDPIMKLIWVSFRVGAFWIAFPFVVSMNLPAMVRVASALTLSMALVPLVGHTLPHWSVAAPPDMPELVAFTFREITIGLGLGFLAKFIFSAALSAAGWMGSQIGFSAATVVNPEFQDSDTSWSSLHGWIALMVYLAIGGHWFTLQALAESYQFSFNDFYAHLTDPAAGVALWSEVGTRFFTWMLKLSGPMLVVIMVLQAGLGVLSKFVPQINIWVVSMPITIGVGVLVFAISLPMYGEALQKLFSAGLETQYLWLRFLGAR